MSGKGAWGKGPPGSGGSSGQGSSQGSGGGQGRPQGGGDQGRPQGGGGQGRPQGGGGHGGHQGGGGHGGHQGGGGHGGHQGGGGQGRPQGGGGQGGHQGGGGQGRPQGGGGHGGHQGGGGQGRPQGGGDQGRPQGGGRGDNSRQGEGSQRTGPGYPTANFQRMNVSGQGGNFGGGRGSRGRGGGGGSKTGSSHNSDLPLSHEKNFAANFSSKWANLPLKEIELPARKDSGKAYKTLISIRANHYPARITFPKVIYHYVVAKIEKIRPPKPESSSEASGSKPSGPQKKKKGGGSKPGPKQEQASSSGAEEPALPKYIRTFIHQELITLLEKQYAAANPGKTVGIISDRSKDVYSTAQLEASVPMENEVTIMPDGVDGNEEKFKVTLEATTENIETAELQEFIKNMVNRKAPAALVKLDQVYNVLMKNLKDSTYTSVGRSSLINFTRPGHPLSGGLMNFTGYDVTIGISGNWKPYVNIHYANCAAKMDKNVITVLANLFQLSEDDCKSLDGWSSDDIKKAKSFLATCKVQYQPCESQRKVLSGGITDFSDKTISEMTFMLNEGTRQRKISIFDYFKEKYGRRTLNPNGPCLVLNSKNYVPAEICVIKKGQSINRFGALDGTQTKNMLFCAKKDPQELKPIIDCAIPELKLKSDKAMKAFGVEFENNVQMITFDKARVLAPPDLCYGPNGGNKNMRVTPDNGLWDSWRLNAKFLQPVSITKWGILLTCTGYGRKSLREPAKDFAKWMTDKGKMAGLEIKSAPIVQELILKENDYNRNVSILKKEFEQTFNGCTIVVVVIPSKGSDVYRHVKQAAELHVGMLTQCVTKENFDPAKKDRTESIVGNILLKINSKLGGINHVVEAPRDLAGGFTIFTEPVMILGADVTHQGFNPAMREEDQISYAAVTCSINRTGMPFMMHVQSQTKEKKGAAEVVQGLDIIVKKCLVKFWENTRVKPRKIFYYRDGVGEGQFPELLDKEMRQIRAGCTSFNDDNGDSYQPGITFITVQKRHKTRFFPADQKSAVNNNAPPGTVVDTEIVHPRENDFFLLSHYGAMGTSRPTRYHVLWDDSDFSSDKIQQLTYYLCYMYVRCNRSVSYPAPTYYAHWAAARAKVLAVGLPGTQQQVNAKLKNPEIYKKYPMHFI